MTDIVQLVDLMQKQIEIERQQIEKQEDRHLQQEERHRQQEKRHLQQEERQRQQMEALIKHLETGSPTPAAPAASVPSATYFDLASELWRDYMARFHRFV